MVFKENFDEKSPKLVVYHDPFTRTAKIELGKLTFTNAVGAEQAQISIEEKALRFTPSSLMERFGEYEPNRLKFYVGAEEDLPRGDEVEGYFNTYLQAIPSAGPSDGGIFTVGSLKCKNLTK